MDELNKIEVGGLSHFFSVWYITDYSIVILKPAPSLGGRQQKPGHNSGATFSRLVEDNQSTSSVGLGPHFATASGCSPAYLIKTVLNQRHIKYVCHWLLSEDFVSDRF
jgi:hypothetical protein